MAQRTLRIRQAHGEVSVWDGEVKIYAIDHEGDTSAPSDYRGVSERNARLAILRVRARQGERASDLLAWAATTITDLYGQSA